MTQKLTYSAVMTLLGASLVAITGGVARAQVYTVPISSTLASALPAGNNCSGRTGLACVMPNLYGPYGLTLPNSPYPARFSSPYQSTFTALNDEIATQITLLPVASPASGFTYEFDNATGLYKRSAQTFGPVLTERAETIGKGKIFFGATYQRFRFSTIDGHDLHNWPAVFAHQSGTGPNGAAEPYESQFITTNNSLDLKVNQFTFFSTFGITDGVDVSVAIPYLQVGMNAASYATIQRTVGTEPAVVNGAEQPCCSNGPPYANYFDPAAPATSVSNVYTNGQYAPGILNNASKTNNLYFDPSRHSAAGLGDVILRFKSRLYRSDRITFAALTDVRLPTGDAMNFLGSGAQGWRPFLALSVRTGRISPHFNAGYQWNGSSVLAGNIWTGAKDNLPSYGFFSAGSDMSLVRRVTIAFDYIGQELINAPRIGVAEYTSTAPLVSTGEVGTFPTIAPAGKQTYNQSNVAFGIKANVVDRLVVSTNLLVAVNQGGLRERVVPLVGLSYTF